MPEVVSLAIKLCFRAKDKRAIFLPNLGKILHYQNEGNSDMIETDVYQYVKLHHEVKNFLIGCFELIRLRLYDKKCFYYTFPTTNSLASLLSGIITKDIPHHLSFGSLELSHGDDLKDARFHAAFESWGFHMLGVL